MIVLLVNPLDAGDGLGQMGGMSPAFAPCPARAFPTTIEAP